MTRKKKGRPLRYPPPTVLLTDRCRARWFQLTDPDGAEDDYFRFANRGR